MTRRAGLSALPLSVAGVLLLAACQGDADATPEVRPAPELAGTDLDGRQLDIADLAGEVVVVNAWASWCGPCREEMPVLAAAQETLGAHGLHVLGLNVRDNPSAAEQMVEETGVNFPSIVDSSGTLAVSWGVRGMPQTFVVDRDGRIVAHRFGAVDEEWIDETVSPLVEQQP